MNKKYFITSLSCILFIAATLISLDVHAQAGSLDPTFDFDGKVMTNVGRSSETGRAMVVQPDGKIILSGSSASDGGSNSCFAFIRVNPDGSLDTGFGNGGIVSISNSNSLDSRMDEVYAMVLQPDGKIVAAGTSTYSYGLGAIGTFSFLRLNPDGTLDTSFGNGGISLPFYGFNGQYLNALALQPDGKLVFVTDNPHYIIGRLNTDGTADNSFGNNGLEVTTPAFLNDQSFDVTVQTDGKIVVAGSTYDGIAEQILVRRFLTDGTTDSTFAINGAALTAIGSFGCRANSVKLQQDGKIIAGGCVIDSNYITRFALVRYNSNGTIDSSFNSTGIALTDMGPSSDEIFGLDVQPNGRIVAAGQSITNNFALAKYKANGVIDSTFSLDGKTLIDFTPSNGYCYAVGISPAGKIVLGGFVRINAVWGHDEFALAQFNTDGTPDAAFNSTGIMHMNLKLGYDKAYAMVIQPDGKIVTAGVSGIYSNSLVRYNTNGSLDNSFGTGGIAPTDGRPTCLAVQADGKILMGVDFVFGISRFNPDGTVDSAFGPNGNGKVFITDLFSGGVGGVRSIVVQPDGKIVAAGYAGPWPATHNEFALARFNSDGSLDMSFSGDGTQLTEFTWYTMDEAYDVALQTDGKIVAGGMSNYQFALVRYNTDGSLDNSFGTGGMTTSLFNGTTGGIPYSIAIQANGKIIAAGYVYDTAAKTNEAAVARYNANGALDNNFGTNGFVESMIDTTSSEFRAVALQSDGRIVAAGFININPHMSNSLSYDFALCRYNTNGILDTAFGSDGIVSTGLGSDDDRAYSMAIDPGGSIVLAGHAFNGSDYDFALARYLSGTNSDVSESLLAGSDFNAFPNPAKENIVIYFSSASSNGKTLLQLMNCKEEILQSFYIMQNATCINLADFPAGVYILKLTNNEGTKVKKIIKE